MPLIQFYLIFGYILYIFNYDRADYDINLGWIRFVISVKRFMNIANEMTLFYNEMKYSCCGKILDNLNGDGGVIVESLDIEHSVTGISFPGPFLSWRIIIEIDE